MHTSFEGKIGRMVDGEPVWERPRTWREAGYRRTITTFSLGVLTALPLALALMLYLIKT